MRLAFMKLTFQDPSVQRAVEGTGGNKANLDDYNPFDAQKNATSSGNAAGKNLTAIIILDYPRCHTNQPVY